MLIPADDIDLQNVGWDWSQHLTSRGDEALAVEATPPARSRRVCHGRQSCSIPRRLVGITRETP
ncbi:hypothetical protein Mal4_08420 [Maioricimonas rarisocia]|uniref:Uncharacterized protein n=1 Tax=Maioricimonas rarisocia TaxID=2528026 RepID=A0A517Z260_9PLAN|nr:hypothetical protein Mal4_08420 [Maioricimonas rarisocia]